MLRFFDKKVIGSAPGNSGTPAYIIRCMECKREEIIRAGKPSGSLNLSFLNKKFSRMGWDLGRNAEHDTCPECIALKRKKLSSNNGVKIMSNITPIAPIKAEEPLQMTKEDRRIIFAKIDENYIDETSGYSAEWSDEKIAKDLNVPRAWVSQIREENFGPEVGENIAKDRDLIAGEVEKAKAQMKLIDERVEAVRQAYFETVKRLQSARETFAENVRGAVERLDKISKKR